MTTTDQGRPCWYELATTDIEAAAAFYGSVLGWSFEDSGMPGMSYTLARAADGALVAGITTAEEAGSPPPSWLTYFGCDHCDATVSEITAAGGRTLVEPTDVPGTGRFAVCADPQGAVFGVLQPEPMEQDDPGASAFDQDLPGHGNWHELMTVDISAAIAFYSGLFAWSRGETMDMGESGPYQIVERLGRQIGAVMGVGDAPVPAWLIYFGVTDLTAGVDRITAAGGSVQHGPIEVPGGVYIAVARDPQGGWFAIVGPQHAQEQAP